MDMQYHQHIQTNSSIIKAAFALATQAHQGQMRGKQDPAIPYITHPVMVYDLLKEFGEQNEITLATALLHDVKEDYEPYKLNPSQFFEDLSEKLAAEQIYDHNEIAGYISKLCDTLTNPSKSEMCEGKRMFQVDHAAHLSINEARIKLLDQTASVLDFIMSPNDETFTNEKVQKFNFKALSLVKALAKHYSSLTPLLNLHKTLFYYAMEITNAESSEKEAQLRAAFSWEKALEQSRKLQESPKTLPAHTVPRRYSSRINEGIIATDLSCNADVTGYYCLVNTHRTPEDVRTITFNCLVERLEMSKDSRTTTESSVNIVDNRLVRHVEISPPISIKEFLAIGKDCGAIDNAYALLLSNVSREIHNKHQRAA